MSLNKSDKEEMIKKYAVSPNDTASPQVQIALITKRLQQLNDHFKIHKKDNHSRYGLMKLVGQRKRLIGYLQQKDTEAYKALIKELGIRK